LEKFCALPGLAYFALFAGSGNDGNGLSFAPALDCFKVGPD
jgi:hypothetical protein